METNTILQGDCIEKLKELPHHSVDAIITDPPYGLEFMGKEWDKFEENRNRWKDKPERKLIGDGSGQGSKDFGERFNEMPKYIPKKNKKCKNCGHYAFSGSPCKCETPEWEIDKTYENHLQQFCLEWATECLRVLKPGGFLLSFGGTRTYHRLVCGIEDAGFEIRDTIMWLYGSGFPKSLNIGKQIDKLNGKKQEEFIALGKYLREAREDIPQNQISKFFPSKTGGLTGCVSNWELGMNVPTKKQWIILKRELNLNNKFDYLIDRIEAEREVIGKKKTNLTVMQNIGSNNISGEVDITAPATPEAKQWEGWGTALKPACEPIVVARKPLSEKNVALNVLKWGTGGINIDACRIDYNGEKPSKVTMPDLRDVGRMSKENIGIDKLSFGQTENAKRKDYEPNQQGRFPANIILDEQAGKMLDEQAPETGAFAKVKKGQKGWGGEIYHKFETGGDDGKTFYDKGKRQGASRFFYCAKASKSERNYGCDDLEYKNQYEQNKWTENDYRKGKGEKTTQPRKNNHPTVKPIKLMEYLIKLVSKENAIVLDPFLGSGTTAIACVKLNRRFIGIEKEAEYIKIAEARIKPFLEQEKL